MEELLKSIIEKITNKAKAFLENIIINLFEKVNDNSVFIKTIIWGLNQKIPKQI